MSRSFLKSFAGKQKAAAKFGHKNEDSQEGRVSNIKLCDVMRCWLATKQGTPFVWDSDDAITFEKREPSLDDIEAFDCISTHIVECKCRSGAGADVVLMALYQKLIKFRRGWLL